MLIGHYLQKLSIKGRTALPVAFRKELGEEIILARWYEQALAVFTTDSWRRIVDQVTGGSVLTSQARDTERFLLGGAYVIKLDNQGRFVVPKALRFYASLLDTTIVVFVGLNNRIEIWNHNLWRKREEEIVKNAATLVEETLRHEHKN